MGSVAPGGRGPRCFPQLGCSEPATVGEGGQCGQRLGADITAQSRPAPSASSRLDLHQKKNRKPGGLLLLFSLLLLIPWRNLDGWLPKEGVVVRVPGAPLRGTILGRGAF